MKIILKSCVALLSLVCPAYAFGETPATAGSGMRFRCESDRSQPRYCTVDTSEGVTLVKQLSAIPCMQGRNWDYDRHGVWVSHRCRAEFVTGKPEALAPSAAGNTIKCESRANRIERCAADTSRGVRLTRILSTSACVENLDWGYDDEGIWVAQGCRGEFRVGGEETAGDQAGPAADSRPIRIICQSSEKRLQRCDTAVREGVDLLRQLSKTRCVQGSTWDWDRAGIWVDRGCRAEFRVR